MAVRGFTPQEKQKLDVAAGIASSYFPYLGGIFAKLDVAFDDRIGTVGFLWLSYRGTCGSLVLS